MRPTLYLFVGPPGSGKTTVANMICQANGAMHIWADRERQAMFGHPTHSAEESRQLYKHLNEKTAHLLAAGSSVVFDTNFNFLVDREHLRKLAKAAGADVKIIHMTTDAKLAKARATNGDHAERNGMQAAMTSATFDTITQHYEALMPAEDAIEVDGTNIAKDDLLKTLGLQ